MTCPVVCRIVATNKSAQLVADRAENPNAGWLTTHLRAGATISTHLCLMQAQGCLAPGLTKYSSLRPMRWGRLKLVMTCRLLLSEMWRGAMANEMCRPFGVGSEMPNDVWEA